MRLPRPFFRLAVRFDVARLRAELEKVPASAWAEHPNSIDGNSSVRLITVGGGENDGVDGAMLPTAHLAAMPYVRQVLASFGVVWSRSRLMRLAPGADVPEHADINHHWHHRVRVHIPIVTRPEVRFHCGAEVVHMAAGEAWIFDNWRRHRVENPTPDTRVHLVADTSGSAAFWSFVALSTQPGTLFREHRFDPALDARPLTEATPPPAVMEPAEVETLTRDLTMELASLDAGDEAGAQMARYAAMLEAFARDWRQLYSLHGTRPAGLPELARLRDNLRQVSRTTGARLTARTNGVEMPRVLEGKLLRALLPGEHTAQPLLSRPVFIVAAPRSGSTLLWETLATHAGLATLGGEAHWLVESDAALRPGAPGVDSNRLTAREATPEVVARIRQLAAQRAVDSQGAALTAAAALRLLEKTPKNALRIPFFERIFPDAQFIFLWRDPRENLASIIEAWDSGGWITYPELPGWQGSWSLLLPPMWQHLAGRPRAAVAAWQWDATNRIVLDDLAALAPERWTSVSYAELLADPARTVERLTRFIGLPTDPALTARVAAPLPHSQYTQTPPAPDKWRRHEAVIAPELAALQTTWERLRALPRR